jgi:transposase
MVAAGSGSLCEPWREQIERFAAEGLSAQRIYQDLAADHGFGGRYNSVKRFVRLVKATVPLPFRRMECEPGAEAQVDFGQGAWVVADGKRRRPHLFRVVLSFSRKGYCEVVWRQDTETFLRCLENAFRHFGGVAKTVVIDNLKAGVLRADWYDPELNPKLASFATHYGTAILPTKPCHPRHKGKVESGVNYAQENAVKGRTFESLGAQNVFLAEWERSVADTRIHGTVRQQVGALFEASERAALQALPPSLFPSFHEARRKVHRDGHVEYAKAYYSVPPEFYGREVWVRAESALVRIFSDRMEQIALHVRADPGRFRTDAEHIHPHKRNAVERGAGHLLQQCQLIGAHSGAWATAMLDQRGVEGLRVLQGLLQLARKHPVAQVERATATAFRQGTWRLAAVRSLIEAGDGQAIQLDFLQEHPLIRSLDHYRLDALFP